MEIEFDPAKDAANVQKHGISLARAAGMQVLSIEPDARTDYGEPRFRAWGMIDSRTYCLIFTVRGNRTRAISLRRAHRKEMERYVSAEIWRLHRGGTP